MEGPILVVYATKHGSTREVAEAVAETLQSEGFEVETQAAGLVHALDPYTAVVIGGAIYTGRWHPDAVDFLKRHRDELALLPVAVFGMGPRTLEPHDVESSRAQLAKALGKVSGVTPCAVGVFGGVVDPAVLHFPFNRMPASDARDWDAIRAWARELAAAFRYGKAASSPVDHRSRLQQTPR
jgi:menaquinone-dependent protoporphyrinogen oxidase